MAITMQGAIPFVFGLRVEFSGMEGR